MKAPKILPKSTIGEIIWGTHSKYGHMFDYVMIALILLSIVGMTVQSVQGFEDATYQLLDWLELLIILIFTAEYGLRIWTAPKKLKYIFSFWGVIDLVAILPYWLLMSGFFWSIDGSQATRTLRLLRMLRLLKLVRYVAAIDRLQRAFELVWRELVMFGFLAIITIFIAAVGIYSLENEAQPEVFSSIPAAMWFAVVTLTTVGYGDVTPITVGGRLFTSTILVVGLGIVAVPTALISAGLVQAREEEKTAKAAAKKAAAARRKAKYDQT